MIRLGRSRTRCRSSTRGALAQTDHARSADWADLMADTTDARAASRHCRGWLATESMGRHETPLAPAVSPARFGGKSRPVSACLAGCTAASRNPSRVVASAEWICECPSSRSRVRPTTIWCASRRPPMNRVRRLLPVRSLPDVRGDGQPGPTDAWVTLGALARETHRVRLGSLLSPVTFRLPGPMPSKWRRSMP
jgi:hypothetical protein